MISEVEFLRAAIRDLEQHIKTMEERIKKIEVLYEKE